MLGVEAIFSRCFISVPGMNNRGKMAACRGLPWTRRRLLLTTKAYRSLTPVLQEQTHRTR